MKILIVSQYFWPENFRINALATDLRGRGHEVSVLTGIPNYPGGRFFRGYGFGGPWREEWEGVRIFRVPLLARGSSKGVRLALNYFSFILTGCLLGPFVYRDRPDAIFTVGYSPITAAIPAILLGKLRHAPVTLWMQDLWPESLTATGAVSSPRAIETVRGLVRWIYRSCDRVLGQSRSFVEAILGLCPDLARVDYLPNSAEALYQPRARDPQSEEARLMPRGFVVIFAGNIGVAQDFETILSAASRLRDLGDLHWVVLGDGRDRARVQREVKERGLDANFHLLGSFPIEKMPQFFAQADALLVSLKRDPIFAQTIPGKVQSYLACARPIVANLEGEGARAVEESGAGIACAPETPEALAAAVQRLYAMPAEEREALGRRGRAYFEREFSTESQVARLEGWLSDGAARFRAR